MLDSLRVFAREIATVLLPGEQPLFCGVVAYFPGEEELGVPAEGNDLLDVVMGAVSEKDQRRADRLLTGRTLIGWPGCEAQQLSAVLMRPGTVELLLTDQRLVLLDTDWTVRWSYPRDRVRSIVHRWRLGQAGRVGVQLGDGSALALVLGVFSGARARRLLRAWRG